jgi:hypothetical protein
MARERRRGDVPFSVIVRVKITSCGDELASNSGAPDAVTATVGTSGKSSASRARNAFVPA